MCSTNSFQQFNAKFTALLHQRIPLAEIAVQLGVSDFLVPVSMASGTVMRLDMKSLRQSMTHLACNGDASSEASSLSAEVDRRPWKLESDRTWSLRQELQMKRDQNGGSVIETKVVKHRKKRTAKSQPRKKVEKKEKVAKVPRQKVEKPIEERPFRQKVPSPKKAIEHECIICHHVWSAVNVKGCPACVNYIVTSTNNLAVVYPDLAGEYESENEKPASEIFARSSKKVWWKCRICTWRWQASCKSRAGLKGRQYGSGCPSCMNRIVTPFNNLAHTHPELAREYAACNEKPANEVYARTNAKLWWTCSKCNLSWQACGSARTVDNGIRTGSGCPRCANENRKGKRKNVV